MLMMLCRSSGSIVAFAEPSRADAHDAGQLFSLHRCFLAQLMLMMLGLLLHRYLRRAWPS